jgi:alcohol dehydrogenase
MEKNLILNLKKLKKKKKFIITGKNSYYLSGASKFFDQHLNENTNFFFKKENIPTFIELKKIILRLKKFKPDIIFAIGGGSVMDYAKIANNLNDLNNLKKNIINSKKKFNKLAKLIAIPTTAGSGSEVTSGAVIYIDKIKYSVEGNEIIPDEYFLIPRFITGNKKDIKISSGFDAISQAIESLISLKSNQSSLLYAKRSLKLSLKNYLSFVNKPNHKNSFEMLLAANLAGKAIAISKTTAPHAVSYPLTSHFGISHGNAVSITLDDFLIFNYLNIEKSKSNFDLRNRYKLLFNLTNTKNIFQLVQFIKILKKNSGTENKFNRLNLKREIILPKILSGVNLARLSNNPINLGIEDLKFILYNRFTK